MIKKITKDNYHNIDDTFLTKDYLEKEFNNNPFARFLLLIDNNKIIGYLYYSEIYDRLEINQFEVKKEYRKKGNGDLLLKELINSTKKNITLEVKESNVIAINLYKKNGFVEVSKRKNYYNGEDGILMQKII